MFDPNTNNTNRGCQGWYRPINPNEHIYIAGYGFSPKPPFLIEQKLIAHCSAATSLCLIGFLFLSSFLTQFCNQLLNRLTPIALYAIVNEPIRQFSILFGSIGALTIPFLLYGMHTHIPFHSALPLRRVPARLIIVAVMLSLSVSVIGIYASEAFANFFSFFHIFFYQPILVLPEDMISTVLYVLNITVVPAIFEEIAFRGVIMQSLRRFGDSFALLTSACLFALVHISPLSMPHAFLMGLIIGYFVLFTGSLHTGMIIHLVHNVFSLLISQLGNLDHSIANIIFLSIQLIYMLLGTVAVLWLLRGYDNMFALKHSDTINRSSQKLRCFFCTLPFALFLVMIFLQAGAFLT
ncbi:lysostaphin resistance A-like protein [Oscillospiraceae bacterium LTW-04]|nr:type II CAAX endopeptidase family protein [Oscillospiraceae bacterium MB24-C1]